MSRVLRSPTISPQQRHLGRPASRQPSETPPPPPVAPTTKPEEPTQTYRRDEVERLVEQAKAAIIEQLKGEAEAARELGRQRGLLEGRQTGIEEGRRTLAEEVARLRSVTDELAKAVRSGFAAQEELAVAVAYEAVCRIVGQTAVTAEGIRGAVNAAAAELTSHENVVVHLHPADFALLREIGALDTVLSGMGVVSWIGDRNVSLGGCIIETSGGALDARLETQLAKLREVLLEARG